MGIHRYLDASTAYMTERDNVLLTDGNDAAPHTATEHGFWIWAGDLDPIMSIWRAHGMSDDFLNVLTYACQQKCQYVLFDCDGDKDIPLPRHY